MRVFIVCPANIATGGTELLHQFSKCLSDNHCENYMVYIGGNGVDCPTPEAFLKYEVKYVSGYIDAPDSVLVCPETQVACVTWCRLGTAMIWWLSVDNYLSAYRNIIQRNNMELGIFDLKKRSNVLHFVQSYYARNFLESILEIDKTFFLKDYINDEIINVAMDKYESEPRRNICLYNPKKGYEDLEPVIKACREDILWVPLQGMTARQMAQTMCKSKVYVDFGSHPGKDRIPREAAVCGCCILTNRKGSAAYPGDVNIPGKYKIENTENVDQVLEQIYDLIDNYEERTCEYDSYREGILNEKAEFLRDAQKAIGVLQETVACKKKEASYQPAAYAGTFEAMRNAIRQIEGLMRAAGTEAEASKVMEKLLTADYVMQIVKETMYEGDCG